MQEDLLEVSRGSDYTKQIHLHEKIDHTFPAGTHKDESFDIQGVESNALRSKPYNRKVQLQNWALYFAMGVTTGIIAFLMNLLEDFLFEYKLEWTQELLTGYGFGLSWFVYIVFSMIMVTIAVTMSLYYGPGAIGSGVAETIGVVNGVNYVGFIGLNTLITKALGVVFAVSGGLRVGKEGPLAHVGSLVGVAMIYLPLKFT
jgi:chloride channel 7